MKRILLIIVSLLVAQATMAQSNKGVSPVGSLNIVKEVKPPILQLEGQIAFSEPSGNNAIDANERCKLIMKLKNSGMGDGYSLKGRIALKNGGKGVSVRDVTLPVLKVGASHTVEFPIEANMSTEDGMAEFDIYIEEPNGFGTPHFVVKVPTRAFVAPMVEFRGCIVQDGSVTLYKGQPYTLQVLVQNTGYGKAEQVSVNLKVPENVYLLNPDAALSGVTLASGESRTLLFNVIMNQNYSGSSLVMNVDIDERYHRYSKDGVLTFTVAAGNNPGPVVINSDNNPRRDPIAVVSLGSDVDKNIPQSEMTNARMRVMIIANQNYLDEKPVGTALSDGRIMKEYCVRTLGIPANQVELLENRTSAQMKADVEAFAKSMRINSGDHFLFFYFGHGMHDANPSVNDAYLIPVDGTSVRLNQTGVSRNWMMQQFEKSKPEQLVVYLESCFSGGLSGSTHDSDNLDYSENSSGLRLQDNVDNSFKGNIVLITASSNKETANAYVSQNHNVFTYEFLKALQHGGGSGSLGELFSSVQRATTRTAWNELGRDQNPSITVSSTLGDGWKIWTLMPEGRKRK